MLTEDELIESLEQRGVPISKRVLTDWRRKGFLPPLESKGRGRGSGKAYYWSDPRIVERAALVDELLLDRFKGENIRLVLWLFGHDVPPHFVRRQFAERVEGIKRMLTGGGTSPGEIYDGIDDFVARYFDIAAKVDAKVNGRDPEVSLPTDMPSEAMETLINVLANDGYDLSDTPFSKGARLLAERSRERRLAGGGSEPDVAAVPNDETLRDAALSLRKHFTLSKVERALSEASDAQLLRARSDLGIISDIIRDLVKRAPELEQLRPFLPRMAHLFGSIAVVIALTLRNEGRGDLIDAGLTGLLERSRSPEADGEHGSEQA